MTAKKRNLSRKGKLALVTGGAGFIGSNLVRGLLARRWQVRVLDNFSTGMDRNISDLESRIEVIRGDIRTLSTCRRALKDTRAVFHLAALPSVARSVEDPISSNEVNVSGTLNLLEAAREQKVESFVYSSSSSVYGDTPRLPKRERMRETPMSPYAVSKLTAEKYCQIYARLYGLRTVALRYFNVYGPRQDPSSEYSAVIPKFITALLGGRRPEIYGDGRQTRDFTFIKDVVEANLLAAAAGSAAGTAVNIGAGSRYSLLKLVKVLNSILGTDLPPLLGAVRLGDVRHSLAAVDLAGEVIGYQPRYSLEEGLRETVKYFRSIARPAGSK
jgi:UDP-glucose 4-epimerase